MISQTEFIEVGGKLFQVIRHVKESSKPIVDTWKEQLRADKVFKKEGYYFFCRLIEEAVIEEEILYEKPEEKGTVIDIPEKEIEEDGAL